MCSRARRAAELPRSTRVGTGNMVRSHRSRGDRRPARRPRKRCRRRARGAPRLACRTRCAGCRARNRPRQPTPVSRLCASGCATASGRAQTAQPDRSSMRTSKAGWLYFVDPPSLIYKMQHGVVDVYLPRCLARRCRSANSSAWRPRATTGWLPTGEGHREQPHSQSYRARRVQGA